MIKVLAIRLTLLQIFFSIVLFTINQVSIALPNQKLTETINKIITTFDANLNIGMIVQDAMTGSVLYEKNPNRYFMPASNQKLFTALAALHYLSPRFTYQTRIYVDDSLIQNGTLNGDVYLQFSGDPTFTLAQLDHLINGLSQIGIKKLNGNFIVDDTLLDTVELSPGSTWDDKAFCFGAPLSALIINHNCVTATLTPASAPDQPAQLILPQEPQFIRLVNHVMTRGETISEDCELTLDTSDEKNYTINGCMKTSDTAKKLLMAVKNPHSYIQSAILFTLRNNQIQGTPKVSFEKIDHPPKLIATAASPPLKVLITTMLKESDNLIANALFKTLGALFAHDQGKWENGSKAVKNILNTSLKISLPNQLLVDGAGSSRYNLITPKQVITLLQHAYTSPYAPTFISALPVSGVDGTLKDRMKDPTTLNRVRAKTGSEKSAVSLSGYLISNQKRMLIFTILINGFIESPAKYRTLEDQICSAIITNT